MLPKGFPVFVGALVFQSITECKAQEKPIALAPRSHLCIAIPYRVINVDTIYDGDGIHPFTCSKGCHKMNYLLSKKVRTRNFFKKHRDQHSNFGHLNLSMKFLPSLASARHTFASKLRRIVNRVVQDTRR